MKRDKKRLSGIYSLISISKGHRYVGCATYIKSRISSHLAALRHNRHHSVILQNHFNKYGEEDIAFEILELVDDVSTLVNREQFYIDTLFPRFNVCPVAGRCEGRPVSEKTRDKLRKAFIGKSLSEEHKRKIGEKSKGRKHTPEALAKLKLVNKGRVRSQETRKKLKDANTGKKATPEAIVNMRKAWFKNELKNRIHITRISKNNIGRKWTPEYRTHMESIMASAEYKAKISAVRKGVPWSAAHREAYKKAIEFRKLKSERHGILH